MDFDNRTTRVKELKRGEVYYIRFDDGDGYQTAIGRPAIIVSSEYGLKVNRSTVMVVYCTTNLTRTGSHFVRLTTTGRISLAKCNEIYTVDRQRVDSFMCTLNEYEMKNVDEQIATCLGITLKDNDCVGGEEQQEDEVIEKATPVDVEDEKAALEVEAVMYKRLYEKALNQLVELKFDKDSSRQPELINYVETQAEQKKTTQKYFSGKVNINSAQWDEIYEKTGISEKTARNIVVYRNKNGKYKSTDDLLNVPRFGVGCMRKYGGMLEV